jgi:hypothetical protein
MKNMIFVRGLLAITLLLALGTFPGCDKEEQAQSKPAAMSRENVTKEVKEAYSSAKAYTEEQMLAFREQTETRLTEYGKGIDQLQAKTEKLAGDAKTKAEQQLTVLRQKRDAVSEKLKELGSSSKNAWEQLKSGVDTAMEDLGNTYKKTAAEFNEP